MATNLQQPTWIDHSHPTKTGNINTILGKKEKRKENTLERAAPPRETIYRPLQTGTTTLYPIIGKENTQESGPSLKHGT